MHPAQLFYHIMMWLFSFSEGKILSNYNLSAWYFKDHIGNKCTLVCFNVSSLVIFTCMFIDCFSCIIVILLNKFNSIQYSMVWYIYFSETVQNNK